MSVFKPCEHLYHFECIVACSKSGTTVKVFDYETQSVVKETVKRFANSSRTGYRVQEYVYQLDAKYHFGQFTLMKYDEVYAVTTDLREFDREGLVRFFNM